MRQTIIVVCGLFVLAWAAATLGHAQATPIPYVYRIDIKGCDFEPTIRRQTGFRVEGMVGIVTALHGLADCDQIDATADNGLEEFESLTIREVDIAHDIVVLASSELDELPTDGLVVSPLSPTEIMTASLRIVGYPRGLEDQDIDRIESIRDIESLDDVIPDAEESVAFIKRKSPDLGIDVLNVQAQLLPGHSGAPIIDSEERVVAIGNGGLRSGSDGRSWAIPWNTEDLQSVELEAVQEDLTDLAEKDFGVFSFSSTFPSQVDDDAEELVTYTVQVVDADGEPIANAEVLLTYREGYWIGLTDSEGFYTFQLDSADGTVYAQSQLQIEATGYRFYTRNLSNVLTRRNPEKIRLTAIIPTATATPPSTPTATATESIGLTILDSGLTQHTYFVEGAIDDYQTGDPLIVYTELNPGNLVAIALLEVTNKGPDSLTAQALLEHPQYTIRAKMQVDGNKAFLSQSQLIPVFDYAVGYFLRSGSVRLRPDHDLAAGAQLQVLALERIDGEIVDAFPEGALLEVRSIGLDGQVARVALVDGVWPEVGALVAVVQINSLSPQSTATEGPATTPTSMPTPIPIQSPFVQEVGSVTYELVEIKQEPSGLLVSIIARNDGISTQSTICSYANGNTGFCRLIDPEGNSYDSTSIVINNNKSTRVWINVTLPSNTPYRFGVGFPVLNIDQISVLEIPVRGGLVEFHDVPVPYEQLEVKRGPTNISLMADQSFKQDIGNVTYKLAEVKEEGGIVKVWVVAKNEGASTRSTICSYNNGNVGFCRFIDESGNPYDGIYNSRVWNFVDLPSQSPFRFELNFPALGIKNMAVLEIPVAGGLVEFHNVPVPYLAQ